MANYLCRMKFQIWNFQTYGTFCAKFEVWNVYKDVGSHQQSSVFIRLHEYLCYVAFNSYILLQQLLNIADKIYQFDSYNAHSGIYALTYKHTHKLIFHFILYSGSTTDTLSSL